MNKFNEYVIILIGVVVMTSLFLIGYVVTHNNPQPPTADKKFEVVDTYKGCDVVEYSPTNAARYYYFLHCPK